MSIGDLVSDEWGYMAIIIAQVGVSDRWSFTTSKVEISQPCSARNFIPFGHNLTEKVKEKT